MNSEEKNEDWTGYGNLFAVVRVVTFVVQNDGEEGAFPQKGLDLGGGRQR
jgi:hypothetical protein